jgi:glycosyltransferase involved in cell wall biosynthesis
MKPLLEKEGAKNLFFLHNAIESKELLDKQLHEKKDITFLWLNRIIPERRSDWFVNVLKKQELKNTVNYLVGFIQDSKYQNIQNQITLDKSDNLVIEEYSGNPSDYYKRAKFFVLPSQVIFANHSLLEAMSYGVVPLVSRQPGSDLIVDDGKNGFIFQHDKTSFENIILYASKLDEPTRAKYAEEARKKIVLNFSEEKYFEGIGELYARVDS